ncbi:MAG: TylF/MycF/NovP-related O-methyltransferase, partial [bacterium]
FIECGVWRGGASIFARGVLDAYGEFDRKVWLADSFRGLPEPAPETPDAEGEQGWHLYSELAVSLDHVKWNFSKYCLLSDRVEFLEGWFSDTLPDAPVGRLAVLRADGDMYSSTQDILENLYGKLSPGGYVIIDDYRIDACRKAVEDFRAARGIHEPIEEIDWSSVLWRRAL